MAAQCDALGQDLQAARAQAHALQVCPVPISPTPRLPACWVMQAHVRALQARLPAFLSPVISLQRKARCMRCRHGLFLSLVPLRPLLPPAWVPVHALQARLLYGLDPCSDPTRSDIPLISPNPPSSAGLQLALPMQSVRLCSDLDHVPAGADARIPPQLCDTLRGFPCPSSGGGPGGGAAGAPVGLLMYLQRSFM